MKIILKTRLNQFSFLIKKVAFPHEHLIFSVVIAQGATLVIELVVLAAAILIAKGYSADEAMALIARRRPKADPYAGHIERQIKKFEAAWQSRTSGD